MPSAMKRILLADDDPDTLLVLKDRLESLGYQVHTVSNGQEAVEEVGRGDFSAVIMDIKMPELDGIEALRKIKQNRPNTPVIMITSVKEKILDVLAVGAEACLLKPVDPDRLREALERGLKNTT
ncbi:MAG TPA: response regulator [Nitrospiria bacterium]|nr:response regulator [Nitrospiria bacterium]